MRRFLNFCCSRSRDRAGLATSLAYGAPALPFAMLSAPALSIIPGLYVQAGAVPIELMGIAMLLTRGAEAVVGPVVGVLSDRAKAVARRRWLILGAAVLATIAWHQWLQISAQRSFTWFVAWTLCLVAARATFEIVHRAWLSDFAGNDAVRLRLAGMRSGMVYGGTLLAFAILECFRGPHGITQEALTYLSYATCALLVGSALVFVFCTSAPPTPAHAISETPGGGDVLREAAKILALPQARWLLAAVLCEAVASGMTGALYFFYMDDILELGWAITQIALVAAVTGAAAAMLMPNLLQGTKMRQVVTGSNVVISIVLFLLACLPAAKGGLTSVVLLFALAAIAVTASEIAITAFIANVVEQARSVTGSGHAASFYAAHRFVGQAGLAAGAALAFALAAAAGFGRSNVHGEAPMIGVLTAFAGIPILLHLAGAFCARQIPDAIQVPLGMQS